MNKTYMTKCFGRIVLSTSKINKFYRIKVSGMVNGKKVNTLVGVSGLLRVLGGNWDKLVKMVLRAFNCLNGNCTCKIYGGAKVTFYCK